MKHRDSVGFEHGDMICLWYINVYCSQLSSELGWYIHIGCTDGFGHGHKTPGGPNMVWNWDLKLWYADDEYRIFVLAICVYIIYILWNQHPGTKRKKTWMEDATCRSSTRSLQKAKRIHHGPKIGTTHLEAGLLILVLWPHFWVQNLAPVLGPQNTNRS